MMARKRTVVMVTASVTAVAVTLMAPWAALADQVIPDDLIVQSSACVGFDCVNGEDFGFDTIRLKENNLRIKAEDTSTGSFPTTDWQLTFNDSLSGGVSKFSVDDVTGAKTPFTIVAGARTNALFVSSSGRVGLGTGTPQLDLHIKAGNTPGVRFEQDGTSGFTAQTWDVSANETNFFIRDVTAGSRLPFRIRPGAPTSSIDIASDGDVGFRTANPQAPVHVALGAGAPGANSEILLVERTGGVIGFVLKDSDNAAFWNTFVSDGGDNYRIRSSAVTSGRPNLSLASSGVAQFRTIATAPATAGRGDIYFDTSGAFCVATNTNTWTNISGVGSCV